MNRSATLDEQYKLRCELEEMAAQLEQHRKQALEENDEAMCESRQLAAYIRGLVLRFDEEEVALTNGDMTKLAQLAGLAGSKTGQAHSGMLTLKRQCSDLWAKANRARGL